MIRKVRWYVKNGFPVIPLHWVGGDGSCSCRGRGCQSPGKHPLTPNGVKDASTDLVVVNDWWTKWPAANIGYAVPRGRLILDLDGEDLLQAFKFLDLDLPVTPTVRTGRGWQLHYQVDPDAPVGPKSNILESPQGVDVRAPGGYGILPPSQHANGRVYSWHTPPTNGFAEAPDWLVEKATVRRGGQRLDIGEIIEGVAEGERNTTVYKYACSLRSRNVAYGEARALVMNVAAACTPPLPELEAMRCLESAWRHPAGTSWGDGAGSVPPDRVPEGPPPVVEVQYTPVEDLMKQEHDPIVWVVPEILPEGLCLFVGPPKTGKSWMAFSAAFSIGSGDRLLGRYDLPGKAHVLYCDLEQSPRKSQHRARKIAENREREVTNVTFAWDFPELGRGCEERIQEFVEGRPDTKVVVIDTLAKVRPEATGRGTAYDQESRMLKAIQRLAHDLHIAIILVHHDNKTEPDDPLDRVSGSKAMTGIPDTIWILRRKKRTKDAATLLVTGREVVEKQHEMVFRAQDCTWAFNEDRDQIPF